MKIHNEKPSTKFFYIVILLLLITLIFLGVIYCKRHTGKNCNTTNIKLQGEIVVYDKQKSDIDDKVSSEDIVQEIEKAQNDSSIKAVILTVDSPGGSPVGSEQIMTALKGMTKPTVALIEDAADSGAYLASSGASNIFASQYSQVGDIGITNSYVENSKQNIDQGLTYVSLSIGKYKDMFDENKPMTSDERNIVLSRLQTSYNNLIASIALNRHLPLEKVRALADGAPISSIDALRYGLIDEIGGIDEVHQYLAKKIGGSITICE